jgi:hypothetical protein
VEQCKILKINPKCMKIKWIKVAGQKCFTKKLVPVSKVVDRFLETRAKLSKSFSRGRRVSITTLIVVFFLSAKLEVELLSANRTDNL